MQKNSIVAFLFAAAVAISVAACSSGHPDVPDAGDPGAPIDGGDNGGPDGSIVVTDGGPGSECLPDGNPCAVGSGGVCCSGTCDSESGTCEPTGTFCGGPGDACANNADCCTNRCESGVCDNIQCVDVGAACASGSDCCTGLCNANGTCDPLPGATCGIVGESCTTGADCCSTNCQGGVCVRAYYCQADSDICYGDDDCCGRSCSKNDGTPGICQTVTGGGGTCTQGGNPCLNANNCCSRVCADPGSGVSVCQPAGGCALSGAYCDTDQDCCGGGNNPNGSVTCVNNRCDNGTMCNPVGNLCGAKVLPDGGSIPASQNCCDGRAEVCKVDSSGIPRCFGGGSNDCPNGYDGTAGCCIPEGNECQFKDQCCGGAPCLPGGDGVLRCTTAQCTPLGSACTAGTDTCCAGECLPNGGELGGTVCKFPNPGGDGGTGTTPDAGSCSANGATCATAADCCSGTCDNGVCQTPTACQPQGTVCTASADCCSGLSCAIPAGSSTGSCQPSACAAAGQDCSSANPCCTGLACLSDNGGACNDATSCTCNVVIN